MNAAGQLDKAKSLFAEKFFDDNRYRLGRVGRFRINRKFEDDAIYKVREETEQYIHGEDFLAVIRYMMDLRSKRSRAHVDDIDHLGNMHVVMACQRRRGTERMSPRGGTGTWPEVPTPTPCVGRTSLTKTRKVSQS